MQRCAIQVVLRAARRANVLKKLKKFQGLQSRFSICYFVSDRSTSLPLLLSRWHRTLIVIHFVSDRSTSYPLFNRHDGPAAARDLDNVPDNCSDCLSSAAQNHRRILQEADADTLSNRDTRYRPPTYVHRHFWTLDNCGDHFFYNEVNFKECDTCQPGVILYTAVVC